MAFALRNLSVLAYANGFTLWHYKASTDDGRAPRTPRFFAEAGDMLAAGDMVLVSAPDGGCMLSVTTDASGLRTLPIMEPARSALAA